MIRKNKSLIISLVIAAMMNLIHINIFNTDLKTSVTELEKKERGAIIYGVKMTTDLKQYGIIETEVASNIIIQETDRLTEMVEDLLYKSLQKYFQFIWTVLASIFTLSKVQAVIPPSDHSR